MIFLQTSQLSDCELPHLTYNQVERFRYEKWTWEYNRMYKQTDLQAAWRAVDWLEHTVWSVPLLLDAMDNRRSARVRLTGDHHKLLSDHTEFTSTTICYCDRLGQMDAAKKGQDPKATTETTFDIENNISYLSCALQLVWNVIREITLILERSHIYIYNSAEFKAWFI